jgi:predicted enzyme related to lactoylglutathione lyase
MLAQEAAFFSAWFLQDPHLADRWVAKAEARQPVLPLTRLRLAIASRCSRSEFCQAWRLWEEAIIGFQALPEVEVKRTLLGDWLDFGDQILVRQTDAASGSVPVVKTHSSDLYDKLRTSSPVQIRNARVSLRRLIPYFWTSIWLSFLALLVLAASTRNGIWVSRGVAAIFDSSLIGWLWIQRRYLLFDTLRGPSSRWYSLWNTARFQMTENALIFVRDIDSVTPWYVEKLGLCRATHVRSREYDVATYKFKEDGRAVTLTTRMFSGTGKTLRLFTKHIGKMERILSARGIEVGPIHQDIQGTRYFEIHDPEGNVIEVVQDF